MRTIMVSLFLIITGFCAYASDNTVYLIIIDGDTNRGKAQAKFELIKKNWPAHVICSGGEPRLVFSDKIRGLNKGFWIVTAGACSSQKDADAVQKELMPVFKGTYLRKVPAFSSVNIAPTLKKHPSPEAKGYTFDNGYPAEINKGTHWRVYLKSNDPCENYSVSVCLVSERGDILDEATRAAECNAPVSEGDLGSQSGWSYHVSKNNFIHLLGSVSKFDAQFNTRLILKPVDNRIKIFKRDYGNSMMYGEDDDDAEAKAESGE